MELHTHHNILMSPGQTFLGKEKSGFKLASGIRFLEK